jgi:hypothetical protein
VRGQEERGRVAREREKAQEDFQRKTLREMEDKARAVCMLPFVDDARTHGATHAESVVVGAKGWGLRRTARDRHTHTHTCIHAHRW